MQGVAIAPTWPRCDEVWDVRFAQDTHNIKKGLFGIAVGGEIEEMQTTIVEVNKCELEAVDETDTLRRN